VKTAPFVVPTFTAGFGAILKKAPATGGLDTEMPQLACEYTTLDPLPDMWKKILSFLEKENVSIITEQDSDMYLAINEPESLAVILNVGCVHPGFGMIGYSLYYISGDQRDFEGFEEKMEQFMGF